MAKKKDSVTIESMSAMNSKGMMKMPDDMPMSSMKGMMDMTMGKTSMAEAKKACEVQMVKNKGNKNSDNMMSN